MSKSLSPVLSIEHLHSSKILLQWASSSSAASGLGTARSLRKSSLVSRLWFPALTLHQNYLWGFSNHLFYSWASLPEFLILYVQQGAQTSWEFWKNDCSTSQTWESLFHSSGLPIFLSKSTVEETSACICTICVSFWNTGQFYCTMYTMYYILRENTKMENF